MENGLRAPKRAMTRARFSDPSRYFGPGGPLEAEARCLEAGRDLLDFVRPPTRVRVANLKRETLLIRPPSHPAEGLGFDSACPSGRPPNDTVRLRLYRPPGGGGDRVVLFHHPVHQRYWAVWEWFLADLMDRVPVALMAAPWHFERTPPGESPGEGTVNPNPWRLFEAVRQWCWDQAAARQVLRDHCGLEPAAVVGYSLGAFQSLLAAAAGALDLPLVAIASTNRYAWGLVHGSAGAEVLQGMVRAGFDLPRIERMVESIQLERYVPSLRDRPVLFLAGMYDRVDPSPSGRRLEEALRPTRSVWLPAGHGTLILFRQRIAQEIRTFLEEVGVLS